MNRTGVVISMSLIVIGIATSFANEPLWTEAERAAKSNAVFTGQVESITKTKSLNVHEDLYQAVLQVKTVTNAEGLVVKNKLTVYFEQGKNGGGRCPRYVKLEKGERAKFFVRLRTIDDEQRAMLEMGSDVRDDKSLVSPLTSSIESTDSSSKAIDTAIRHGAAAATKDINVGNLQILNYGESILECVDSETGYPTLSVASREVSPTFAAEADAYNAAMREWHKKQKATDQSRQE